MIETLSNEQLVLAFQQLDKTNNLLRSIKFQRLIFSPKVFAEVNIMTTLLIDFTKYSQIT
jgi:23S rRNA C2498 (ribose-2'-O)-methylase RlmM